MVCAGAIFASRAGAGRRAYRVIRSRPATNPRAKSARPMRVAFSRTPGSLRRSSDVPASTFAPRLPDRRARTATQTDSIRSQPALNAPRLLGGVLCMHLIGPVCRRPIAAIASCIFRIIENQFDHGTRRFALPYRRRPANLARERLNEPGTNACFTLLHIQAHAIILNSKPQFSTLNG